MKRDKMIWSSGVLLSFYIFYCCFVFIFSLSVSHLFMAAIGCPVVRDAMKKLVVGSERYGWLAGVGGEEK